MTRRGPSRNESGEDFHASLFRRLSRRIGPVFARLNEENLPAWVVGGALRDLLLGRPLRDVDLAVRASRDQIGVLFPEGVWVGRKVQAFVLSPKAGKKGTTVQITVFSGSIEEELSRRDFSVNALAMRLSGGVRQEERAPLLLDPFGGVADLEAGRLARPCLVRDPFSEDPVRVLRLVRFVATLGFSVDPETLELAQRSLESLSAVAGERRRTELFALFSGGWLRKLSEVMAPGFSGEVLVRAGGFATIPKERIEERLPSLLNEVVLHSGRDPLFRVWVFYRGIGTETEALARSLPWSRSERRRLLRWDRLLRFLKEQREPPWTASERALLMTVDYREKVARMAERMLLPQERKTFREWKSRAVTALCRPWPEVREALVRGEKSQGFETTAQESMSRETGRELGERTVVGPESPPEEFVGEA